MFEPTRTFNSPAVDQVNVPVSRSLLLETDVAAAAARLPVAAHSATAIRGISSLGRNSGPSPPLARSAPSAPGSSFLGVAAHEFGSLMERKLLSLALIECDLLKDFLTSLEYSDRVHKLPEASQPDEVGVSFAWCRQLVLNGHRPALIMTERYLQRVFGQLRETLSQSHLPVLLIIVPGTGAGLEPRSANGRVASHSDDRLSSALSFLRLLPGMAIVSPKDGWELRQMLQFAAGHIGPVAVQVPYGPLPVVKFPDFIDSIEFGKAEILEDGDDVVLLTLGSMATPAIKAAEALSEQGLSVGVVNSRFVQPLDADLIRQLARRVRGIITLEEVAMPGGFGSAVLEILAAEGLATPLVVSGAGTAPGQARDVDADQIVAQIMRAVPALVEHRGQSVLPGWGSARREVVAVERRTALAEERIQTFGISKDELFREHELVEAKRLSPEVEEWVRAYSAVGNRSRYLWKWCMHGVELTILPDVPPELAAHVGDTKLLSIIICVLFDDVADQQQNDGQLLQAMLHITREGTLPDLHSLGDRDSLLAEITWRLWRDYQGRTRTYPFYAVYAELLKYDLMQFFNTMSYSQLINRQLPLLNLAEHDLYTSHNMQMISFSTLDLMCSAGFDMAEMGKLREAMWHAQCMGRIGNLLSTWRREIPDRDFTSGVFARAVSQGDLTIEQLLQGDPAKIEAVIEKGEHELYFYRRWLHHRERLRTRCRQIHSFDLTATMEGHDRFLLMHLGSRGLI